MTKGLRRTLIVGAALLILSIALWFRLDVVTVKAHFDSEVAKFTNVELQAEQSSLTFLHGIGLKLDNVSLKHQQYQVQAGHINISIRLLPLLFGKVEVNTLDIHDAIIKIRPGSMQLTSSSLSSLPVDRIHLIRSNIQTMDGKELLNDLHLELRDIGQNRETLWEIQAQQDNESISGHGRLEFQRGKITSGFGKLKLEQVALARIQPFTPESIHPFISQKNGTLSGALTLDIVKNSNWAVFGELELVSDNNENPIKLRGKFSHPEADHVYWHDSFIHLGGSAVIAVDGQCLIDKCSTRLQASDIDLETWSPVIPVGITFHQQLSGSTKLDAKISWDKDSWQGDIGFNLKEGQFNYNDAKLFLPELQLHASKLSGDATSWQAEASLTAPNLSGDMQISSSQKASGRKEMFIVANVVESKFWQPLSNLLLASLDIQPAINANGTINGKLALMQQGKHKKIQLEVDAGLAKIDYNNLFYKPENIPALCNAEIQWSDSDSTPIKSVSLQDCRIGNGTLEQLRWSKKNKQQHLNISNLVVNLDQLKAKSIRLSKQVDGFRGTIQGSSSSSWTDKSKYGWLQGMSGNWKLQGFGGEHWDASGLIKANNGNFSSDRLLLNGLYGLAELKGHLSLAERRGSIDVISAHQDWSKLPAPAAEMWNKLRLSGSIKQTNINLLQNNWQDVNARYVWKQGELKLKDLKSSVAGGLVTSRSFVLQPTQDGLAVHGKVRLQDLQLQDIQGLKPTLQAEMKGTLHANIELHGTIPDMHKWQQSNGDLLIYSGEWTQQVKAESLTEKLGFKAPEIRSHAFKKLEGRFRIDALNTTLSVIKLQQMGNEYRGSAKISSEGKLAGRIEQQKEHIPYTLSGEWPYFTWQASQ